MSTSPSDVLLRCTSTIQSCFEDRDLEIDDKRVTVYSKNLSSYALTPLSFLSFLVVLRTVLFLGMLSPQNWRSSSSSVYIYQDQEGKCYSQKCMNLRIFMDTVLYQAIPFKWSEFFYFISIFILSVSMCWPFNTVQDLVGVKANMYFIENN